MIPGPVADWLGDLTGLQILLWIVAIVGLGVFIAKAWPVIRKAVKLTDALGELPEFMERIRHQVENDHDENLRDELTATKETSAQTAESVARILTTIEALSEWQKKHEVKSDAIASRVGHIEDRLYGGKEIES